ncbi:MAG: hypothetical protein OHK0015_04760 [Chloroflexi bacterium OHK40]
MLRSGGVLSSATAAGKGAGWAGPLQAATGPEGVIGQQGQEEQGWNRHAESGQLVFICGWVSQQVASTGA